MGILVCDMLVPFFSPTTPKRGEWPKDPWSLQPGCPQGGGLPGGEEIGLLAGLPQTLSQLHEGCLLSKGRAGGGSCLFLLLLQGASLGGGSTAANIWAAMPAGACTGEAGSSGKRRGKSSKEQFPTSLVEMNPGHSLPRSLKALQRGGGGLLRGGTELS